jgi:hypothetical protein
MTKFAADENFNNRVLRGLLSLLPDLDVVRVQDTEVAGASDPVMLEWAAKEKRILLTHDSETVINFAYERVRNQQPMPGVIEVDPTAPIGLVIDHLFLLAGASLEGEWENRVGFIPIKQ